MARKTTKAVFLGLCPVCHQKLQKGKLTFIDKDEKAALCCVECAHCLSSLLFKVSSLKSNVVTTIGILTDLQEEDAHLVKGSAPVTADDVLDLHLFLEKNENGKTQSESA